MDVCTKVGERVQGDRGRMEGQEGGERERKRGGGGVCVWYKHIQCSRYLYSVHVYIYIV